MSHNASAAVAKFTVLIKMCPGEHKPALQLFCDRDITVKLEGDKIL